MEIKFAFECNPWRISDSSMDYGVATATLEDSLKLFIGACIERNKAFSGDYFFAFDILDVVGNSSLTFGLKSYLGVVNNISEGEYTTKWKSPCLTFLDRVGDVITVAVGYKYGLMDKNHFDEIGRFDWNINTPLPVIAYIKDEVIVPANTNVYNASEITTRVTFDNSLESEENVKADQMLGITIDNTNPKSVLVYDIPAHTSVGVNIPQIPELEEGQEDIIFFITKKGNAPNSELVISSDQMFSGKGVWTYTLKEESTVMLQKWGDGFSIWPLDNFTAYRVNKKMKLRVNGLETEYVPVSNRDLDYIMMNLSEVNSEYDSYVELGPIRGGCL